jgi:hypothetical protein
MQRLQVMPKNVYVSRTEKCAVCWLPLLRNVRARHRDGIVIEHSGYQLHIITDIPPDTVVSELTRLFLDVFADPN